jgi:hypothetical protein
VEVGIARRTDPLEGVNLLKLAPVRLASWTEVEGRATLERPRPRGRGPLRMLRTITHAMSVPRVKLDELGSYCWARLDGERTVEEIANDVREAFGEAAEPVEERLGTFVRMLRDQEFLAYPGWDELPPEVSRARRSSPRR